ncbi:hypothetical protein QCA50_001928 [Cerrena zonata]|uniref:ESF1 RRM domain-containing protein n=1 Tax=Cerrena zonata TaxID=2478898 RepID=A0AAW0GNI6_9APHY
MSDPRFARFKTDPRFRKIRKGDAKVTVDDRFKSVFGEDKKKKKGKKSVDKYGRQLTATHESDNLRRFYRLENEDEEEGETKRPDFARGGVLLESSDEEEPEAAKDDDSDDGGFTTLGQDSSKPIPIPDDEVEIDLDEDNLADLDAQAAEYAKTHAQENDVLEIERTRRIAVVNLDWDYVRASHLYKIFSSLVSSTALALPSSAKSYSAKGKAASTPLVARGKVLSVRVYPSQFGKERMAREEQEGPPPEVFKKKAAVEEDINEKTIYETGEGEITTRCSQEIPVGATEILLCDCGMRYRRCCVAYILGIGGYGVGTLCKRL